MMITKFFIYAVLILTLFIGCGGNKEETEAVEAVDESQTEMTEQNGPNPNDEMIVHSPGTEPVNLNQGLMNRGPELEPDELAPGTCEFTAYWFAEYFTSGDSTNAIALCTDSMKIVVREILQKPGQLDNMNRNRKAGYKLESISLLNDDDDDYCRACLTASFMNEKRDDCNFRFIRVKGQWLLNGLSE